MNPKCIDVLNQTAGRVLSQAELANIEDRISGAMHILARQEPAKWASMTRDDRILEAAQFAMNQVKEEAARKLRNAKLQVIQTAATEERISKLQALYQSGRSKALVHELEQTRTVFEAEKIMAARRMMGMLTASRSGEGASIGRRIAMFLWDADNPVMTRDVVREIFANGEAGTGNKIATEGAKAWLATIEELRTRFNAAGGDVRKLEYGYLPQPHDAQRVRMAGAESWANDVLGLLDRNQYLREDGSRMNDAEVLGVLRSAWDTIQSEGLNKLDPGGFAGQGARANRGSDARVLHFKDGDAWLKYMADYGSGNMYDAMLGHIGGMTRSIALVERYGPNPNAQMRLQFDLAARADGELQKVGMGLGAFRVDARGMWSVLSGAASTPVSDVAAMAGQVVRNLQTAGKLAGTVIKSMPDLATYFVATGYNRLPYWQAIANLGRVAVDADTRQFLGMHGLLANSAIESLNRWSAENIRQSWSGQIANSTMRLSLMNAWDDWLTRAFGMTKMNALGTLAGKSWDNLPQWDRALLERRGISEDDWGVVNRAQLDELHGMKFLTPDSIINVSHERSREIAVKVLALIRDESQYAVIKPDLVTQAARTWNGTQAGTGVGELARAVMLFKSFPFAMITRHWDRLLSAPQVSDRSAPVLANRLAYAGALMVTTTALGAISTQAWQVTQGKDPIDMTGRHAGKFWMQAFSTGGGMGFYGDLMMRDSTEDRGAWDAVGKTLGGPVIGDLATIYSLTKGNIDQALAGKPTHAGAESVSFLRAHAPYVNLWYAKAAVDHAGLNALQENLSPGYLSKMRERAAKTWGQDYWWTPRADMPQRAPDLAKAVGQ